MELLQTFCLFHTDPPGAPQLEMQTSNLQMTFENPGQRKWAICQRHTGNFQSTKNGSKISEVKFKMLVPKLSLVQHCTADSLLPFLGISLQLLQYLLITLKRMQVFLFMSRRLSYKFTRTKKQCVFPGTVRFLSKPFLLFNLSPSKIYSCFRFGSSLKHAW